MNQKGPQFCGHFEILKKIGPTAYKLKLPKGSPIHPDFHVSLLMRCINSTIPVQPLPSCLTEEWEFKVQPEEITEKWQGTHFLRCNIRCIQKKWVKWQKYLDNESHIILITFVQFFFFSRNSAYCWKILVSFVYIYMENLLAFFNNTLLSFVRIVQNAGKFLD